MAPPARVAEVLRADELPTADVGEAVRGGSVQRLDRRNEDVARAALGDDQLRARRLGFDLAAQPHDLDVDGAIVDLCVVQPGQAHQLIAREHPLGRAAERRQQAELAVAQIELAAVRRRELAGTQVELPAGEAIGPALVVARRQTRSAW